MRPVFDAGFAHQQLAAELGLNRYFVLETVRGTDTPAMAAAFADHRDEIAAASVDAIGGIGAVIPDDEDFILQWGLNNDGTQIGSTADADIDAPEAWEITTGTIEDPVIIAVLDSGVDPHPDYADRMVPGYNSADPDSTASDDDCSIKHGSHVAGIAVAGGNDGTGIAGVCWGCKLMPVDVLVDAIGGCSGFVSDLAEGMIWAADNGADVINMSLQYYGLTAVEKLFLGNAIEYAEERGVIMVAATGNNCRESGFEPCLVAYPARMPKTLAVGGITSGNEVAINQPTLFPYVNTNWTSNFGPEVDVVAPGDAIWSTRPPTLHAFLSGTSMATPHVAGMAALIRSIMPDMPNRAVCQLIKDTTIAMDAPVETDNPEWFTGSGRVNAFEALLAAPDYPRILDSVPPSGAIDARRPHEPDDALAVFGWDSVELVFPATSIATVDLDDFEVTVHGGSTAGANLSVAAIEQLDNDRLLVTLDGLIEPKAWTRIAHVSSNSRVDLGFMPGDVNGDTAATATDVLDLIDFLNGVGDPREVWSTDLDRSGVANAADILEVVDLLNGAGLYEAYNNTRLPSR